MALSDWWRRLRGTTKQPAEGDLLATLVERLASHFPGATTDGAHVRLPFGGLSVDCSIGGLQEIGRFHSASLFFLIDGGPFDDGPVFASVSGYGDTPLEAVVGGCCNWACAFGPVLRSAVEPGPYGDAETFHAVLDGQAVQVVVQHLDRIMTFEDGGAATDVRLAAARKRVGQGRSFAEAVVRSGTLPVLRDDRPTLLSVFVMENGAHRTVEVKVNGGDWPASHAALAQSEPGPGGETALLRELAMVLPRGSRSPLLSGSQQPLTRDSLERTLASLQVDHGRPAGLAVRWRGFRTHGGRLQAPLGDAVLALDPLPDDYRHFVRDVAAAGAGPGYGLVRPDHPAQQRLRTRKEPPGPSLLLAHAGCNVTWLLALGGPHRGEVWVDAQGSDETVTCVASSFDAWYRRWLDGLVRDVFPAIQWDAHCCATAGVLSQVSEKLRQPGDDKARLAQRLASSIKPGGIGITSGAAPCFEMGDLLDPCAGCVALAAQFGLEDAAFAPGVPPLQQRPISG